MANQSVSATCLTGWEALSTSACLLGGLTAHKLIESTETPELFVFPGSGRGTTVIATTWPTRAPESTVAIHTGRVTWKVCLRRDETPYVHRGKEWRVYASAAGLRMLSTRGGFKLVVVEAGNTFFKTEGPLKVGAERVERSGKRRQAGSPFLAHVVAQNKGLADQYHSTSPELDRALLMQAVKREIAAKARIAGYVNDVDAHACHIAQALLADVVHYDWKLPSGFTFAAQNGRHPGDSPETIAATIINGFPVRSDPSRGVELVNTFPYFAALSGDQIL